MKIHWKSGIPLPFLSLRASEPINNKITLIGRHSRSPMCADNTLSYPESGVIADGFWLSYFAQFSQKSLINSLIPIMRWRKHIVLKTLVGNIKWTASTDSF